MPRKELGEILRQADLVTDEQLAEALKLQESLGERLASVFVRQNVLTEKFAVTYLGRQLGVAPVDLSRHPIDLELLKFVPLDLCERKLVFPFGIVGNRLELAMSDPLDRTLLSEIEFKTGVRIAPFIALESSIKNAVFEARRALRAGQATINPNVQRAKPVPPPAAPPAAPQAGPVKVAEFDDRERTVLETLAGAPIPVTSPTGPPRLASPEELTTVLVVDDDVAVLKATEAILATRRYRVATARNGREALAAVRARTPDLLVVDGMLPEIHGFEICRQIKRSERFRHIPVIMVSGVYKGWRFAADVKETYGADDYLEKPFEPRELLRRVEMLLKRPSTVAPVSEATARQLLKDGVTSLNEGRLEGAIASFERGLAIDQFNDVIHYYLGVAWERKENAFKAIGHYERAIQLNPELYDAITALATLYEAQEFRRKSAEMWELALTTTRDEAVRAAIKQHLLALL